MHAPTFHVDPDIDHKEERIHHLMVDDSLFDATTQRLDGAHAHLDAAAADETVGALRRRLDAAMSQIRHVKKAVEGYYEAGAYSRELHQKFHELTLNIADRAESLARRFEEPGGREQILTAVEAGIADLMRVLDECNQTLRRTR